MMDDRAPIIWNCKLAGGHIDASTCSECWQHNKCNQRVVYRSRPECKAANAVKKES